MDILSRDHPLLIAQSAHGRSARETAAHQHARGQLIGTMTGLSMLSTSAGRWAVPPASAVWVPPYLAHEFRSYGPFHGWSVYIAQSACRALPDRPQLLSASPLLREAVLRAALWPVAEHLTPQQTHIAQVILDEIANSPREEFCLPMPSDSRLLAVAEAIVKNPSARESLSAYAEQASLSERTFSRWYKAQTGFSFRVWQARARVLQAIEWLTEGRAVTTVAFDLGYETVSSFIEVFKTHVGMTPGRFAAVVGGDQP
ncbi:helix-turn-helix domain-containing protein [Acetobacter malorum]|uniref:AraC family transcriptional regulator n=1 Tax=Acetobacter malorum TaxID=178901 RepID=UPI0009ED2AD3|nr:helix-turn-helix transcriptional regulator [Acetobacter malorum]